jgi:D-alanyl-D-alanine dipeptidase
MATENSFAEVTLTNQSGLPNHFVYLQDIDPTIVQDIRYFSDNNFIGRLIKGYQKASCILTKHAALALSSVQKTLKQQHPQLTLVVYDCYRPQTAVDDFIAWSQDKSDHKMKAKYYPNVDKADFFTLGYVAAKSAHTRGSTVDLSIQSLDMGTHFDFMDPRSHHGSTDITEQQTYNRLILKHLMEKNGFKPYHTEWWHYTLINEPYPDTYFNFPVE